MSATTQIRKTRPCIPTYRCVKYPTVRMPLLDAKKALMEKLRSHASQVAGIREAKRSRSHLVNMVAYSIFRTLTWLIIAKSSSIEPVVRPPHLAIWAQAPWVATCCKPIHRHPSTLTCHIWVTMWNHSKAWRRWATCSLISDSLTTIRTWQGTT